MMDLLLRALLETLVYADLFDYPLRLAEINRYLISPKTFELRELEFGLERLIEQSLIGKKDECFFLYGRRHLVETRARRQRITSEKLSHLRLSIRILSRFPFMELICLTGAAAMGNADERGDLDLMVVTARRRMWLTRFMVFTFLKTFGLKRKDDGQRNPRGQICINLWFDEDNMTVPESDRDLVVAHEIAQMKPLVNRDRTYEQFMKQNLWLKRFLANWKI